MENDEFKELVRYFIEEHKNEEKFDYDKEVKGLEAEREELPIIIKNKQNEISSMLFGDMGKDMDDVLSGKKFVTITKKPFMKRLSESFDNFLRKL